MRTPFCGENIEVYKMTRLLGQDYPGFVRCDCVEGVSVADRPIEDELNARIVQLEAEIARRDEELLELNDKAGFVFEVPGIPVAKQSTRFTTKGKRPHAYPDKNVEDWQTTVGQYAMVARTDRAMTRKPVAVKLIFRLPDRRRRDIDNLEKCVLDGLKGVLFEDDDQVVQVTKRKVINKDHPGVTIIVELDNPVEDCE